jgi:hypothetical protein
MDRDPQTHRESQSKPNQIAEVSWTDARLSLCGLLTRTVTATSAPMNSARRAMARMRTASGMVAPGIPTFEEPVYPPPEAGPRWTSFRRETTEIDHFVMAITAAKALLCHVARRELICTGGLRCVRALRLPQPSRRF